MPEDKFKSLGIYSVVLKNEKKILYFDIYHKKIDTNFDTSCISDENEIIKINVIDEYFLYNVTEHIEDKLKIIEENKQKEKIFAKLSHEFKTPLNSIIGMINETLDLKVNKQLLSKLQVIKNLSNYVIFLIADIIQYSNIQQIEDLRLHNIELNIEDILSFCYQILVSLLSCNKNKRNNITTNLLINEDIKEYKVIADESRVKQLLLNLISNSVKFTNSGKIEIKCKKIFDENNNDFIKVEVKDTGIGIKEEDKKRLFKDFEMLNTEESIKNNAGGTGLGLSICRSLISKMHMRMEFKSEYLKGSKFSILFPCVKINSSNKENIRSVSEDKIIESSPSIKFKKKISEKILPVIAVDEVESPQERIISSDDEIKMFRKNTRSRSLFNLKNDNEQQGNFINLVILSYKFLFKLKM